MTRKADVLEVLERADEPMHTHEVAAAAFMTPNACWRHLSALLAEGLIQKSKTGNRGSKIQRRWRLTPNQERKVA